MLKVTRLQAVLWIAGASLTLSVLGCGAGSTTASPSPSPNALNGNWLLVGSLPFLSPPQGGNKGFDLTMTFSVVGDQIVGSGSVQIPCGQPAGGGLFSAFVGGGVVLNGSIPKDGSFIAQTPASQPADLSTLQVQGSLPSSNASSWSGSYTFSSNDSGCPFNSSASFTAVRITDLTGTYIGSASLPAQTLSGDPASGSAQPASFTFSFQQGLTTPETQTVNEGMVNGSVQVQGASCFSSGQIQAQGQLQNRLLGTRFLVTFTMDDGSHLLLSANIEDNLSSKLGVISLLVEGGKCDGQSTEPFELSRQ